MKLAFWRKPNPPPVPEEIPHDESALQAIQRAQDALDEGIEHLEELRARRIRMNIGRRENHIAPAIYEAFKRRNDVRPK